MGHKRRKKGDFSFDFSSLTFTAPEEEESREVNRLSTKPVMFDNAAELADSIDITRDYICLVPGSFIFGDLLEALLYRKRLEPSVVYAATLGMSAENIDSLVNCTRYLHTGSLKLLISNYFAALERHKLIPYMEREFAGEPIEVAVLASHCKLILIRSEKSDILITGSANLSSSSNVEQFVMMHDPGAVDFMQSRLDGIFERFTVYRGLENASSWENNKDNTGKKAWDAISGGEQ